MPSSRVCGQVTAHPELQTLAEEGGGIFGEEEEYHLGTFFRRAMNLVPDSYLENMLWTQVTLHGLADSLDSIYDLISWKDRASTAFITLGIFVSMFLFLVVPFNLFLMIQADQSMNKMVSTNRRRSKTMFRTSWGKKHISKRAP